MARQSSRVVWVCGLNAQKVRCAQETRGMRLLTELVGKSVYISILSSHGSVYCLKGGWVEENKDLWWRGRVQNAAF